MERIIRRPRTEYRREPRYAAELDSIILWEGMRESVTIRNISMYGALLQGLNFPPINTRLTLIADALEVTGTVIWRGADQCGILLSSPVEPLALLRDRPVRTVDTPVPQSVTLQRIGPGSYA